MIRAASRFHHSAPGAALAARVFPDVPDAAHLPGARNMAGGGNSSPPPASLDIALSDDLLMTLRMAAAAERIGLDEAVRRAISLYADGLGLQVLASALDLDPELATQFRQRADINRFKGGAP